MTQVKVVYTESASVAVSSTSNKSTPDPSTVKRILVIFVAAEIIANTLV